MYSSVIRRKHSVDINDLYKTQVVFLKAIELDKQKNPIMGT